MAFAKESDLEVALADLKKLQKGSVTVEIDRDHVFDDCVRILNSEGIEKKRIEVNFKYKGWKEPASDTGGPGNELFTCFYQECMSEQRCMFVGEDKNLFPVDNHGALEQRWFFCLGRAIVMSLVRGGSGFPHLASSCFRKLLDKSNVPGYDNVKALLNKIKRLQIESSDVLDDVDINTLLQETNVSERCKNKSEYRKHIQDFLNLQNGMKALRQMRDGLMTLNFLDKVRNCPELKQFFVYTDKFCVDGAFMKCQLLDPLMELKTTSDHQEQVKMWAAECLANMNDDQAVNLLEFITGMRSRPPGELDLVMEFNMQDQTNKLPRAATCVYLLLLPLGNSSYKEFIRSFKVALDCRQGFGRI